MSYIAIARIVASSVFLSGFAAQSRGASPETTTLNLVRFSLTFEENFDRLSVSAWGRPRSRWIAHTPWNGDFGSAKFVDPHGDFPFKVINGVLQIQAQRMADGRWRSGLLSSVNTRGRGFAQRYGYFEVRAKLPNGPGLRPAFWLIGLDRLMQEQHTAEINVFAHSGNEPNRYKSAIHVWNRKNIRNSRTEHLKTKVDVGLLYDRFNTYGALITEGIISFYFNRRLIWTRPTPTEHRQPMIMLLSLAMDSSRDNEVTPSPSVMQVDYVKVWQSPHY